MPVNTMAIPAASAAAITSASLTEPPGWITATAPASTADSKPSANGKNASDATTDPCVNAPSSPAARAASAPMMASVDTALFRGLQYRVAAHSTGGRATAVAGVPSEPRTFGSFECAVHA